MGRVEAAERDIRPIAALRRVFTGVAISGVAVVFVGILLVATLPSRALPLTGAVCFLGFWLTLMGLWFRRRAGRVIADFVRQGTRASQPTVEPPGDGAPLASVSQGPGTADVSAALEVIDRRAQRTVRLLLALALVYVIVGLLADFPLWITFGFFGALILSTLMFRISAARLTRRLEQGRDRPSPR